jgi:hypothetical protein
MNSSAPTISVSVEILVLSFCLVELTMGNPRPKDRPHPECPRMLGWTANDVSTRHFKMPLPLALKISGILRVPLCISSGGPTWSNHPYRVLTLS